MSETSVFPQGEPMPEAFSPYFTGQASLHMLSTAGVVIGDLTFAPSWRDLVEIISRLHDVAPDGTTTLISRGALIGSQRALDGTRSWRDRNGVITWPWHTHSKDEYLEPGNIYRFDIALSPRQWGIRPGHRLRLELTSQTPADLCPDAGSPPRIDADPCRLTGPQQKTVPGGRYTILYGKNTPSSLNLPQLPYRIFPAVRAGKLALPWNDGTRSIVSTGARSEASANTLLPINTDITHPLQW